MLLWHVGGALLVFRYVFRDPKVDVRFLAMGAVVANLIDKPLWLIAGLPPRSIGHTLVLPMIVMAVLLLVTRRGRRRRQLMAIPVAMLIHLLLDGMWTDQQVLLWPFFGIEFGDSSVTIAEYLEGLLTDPWTWIKEAAGLAYLLFLANRVNIRDPGIRREMFNSGRLPA